VNSHFEAATGGIEADTKFQVLPVPQLYYVYSPKNYPLAFGLGIYAPFGLGLEWPEDVVFRNLALEARLQYLTISPIAAWRINSKLSVAAGPTVNYSDAMLRRGIGFIPGDEFRFRGDGFAYGAKVGLLWQPHPQWSFGLSYFSPTTVKYQGNSTFKPIVSQKKGTSAELDFPQFIMGGISFRPTTNWNVEVGMDWTDWDTVDSVTFKGTAFGDVPFALNWKSSFLAHLGLSRYLQKGYWVSAGYFFSQNSTTDADFNPILPDTDLHVASLGFGRHGEHWTWALSGQIIAGPARQIRNGNAADGSYQFFNQAVNVSVGYHF
jgi:long-chain fatty acid transport protein